MPALGTLGCIGTGNVHVLQVRSITWRAAAQDSAASGECEGALRGPAAAAGLLTGTPKAEHSRAQARRSPRTSLSGMQYALRRVSCH
jgi:hypothetical protein